MRTAHQDPIKPEGTLSRLLAQRDATRADLNRAGVDLRAEALAERIALYLTACDQKRAQELSTSFLAEYQEALNRHSASSRDLKAAAATLPPHLPAYEKWARFGERVIDSGITEALSESDPTEHQGRLLACRELSRRAEELRLIVELAVVPADASHDCLIESACLKIRLPGEQLTAPGM